MTGVASRHPREPVVASQYLRMRDGVRIAVDTWLPEGASARLPAILVQTRYWRGYEVADGSGAKDKFVEEAAHFVRSGFVFVCADARGTGASSGTRSMELGDDEIADMAELAAWVASQSWSNGAVISYGTSYTADSAFLLARHAPECLRMIVAHAMDFDVFTQCMSPGGIPNSWMRNTWGEMVAALDANDFARAADISATTHPGSQRDPGILGVRPVDARRRADLELAVAEHELNFRMSSDYTDESFAYRDTEHATVPGMVGVEGDLDGLRRWGGPVFYRTGWMDAGTADGALQLFAAASNPMHVVIGPWSHGMGFWAHPFQDPRRLPLAEKWDSTVAAVHDRLDAAAQPHTRLLDYYTYGEERWHRTMHWPVAGTITQSWHLAGPGLLGRGSPHAGVDRYAVELDASTGCANRWHTQLSGGCVDYGDRAVEDRKLLTYDSLPLNEDLEVTGTPVVHLQLSSSRDDGAVFAYLEDVAPDGAVRMITEGMLRLIHWPETNPPRAPWPFGPYRSFAKVDAKPFPVNSARTVSFPLIATSVLFRRGHRIRLALAGSDRGTFLPLPDALSREFCVLRGPELPSRIDLPVIPRNS